MTKHEGGRYHDGERFLPWYTSPCLEWLMTLDLKDKFVFEFGGGDSTQWYRSKGSIVHGVEWDREWAAKTNLYKPETFDGYLKAIHINDYRHFDIIVIDGIIRDECTEHALPHIKPGGYLIIDNYHQPSVQMDWPLTDKLIEGMEQTLYNEPGHPDWQTLVVRKA